MMRPRRPVRAKLRARRIQEQQPRRRSLLYEQLKQLKRRRVGPVQIFDCDHYRLHSGGAQHPLDQRCEQPAALLLG
jgi:hypothetical protein